MQGSLYVVALGLILHAISSIVPRMRTATESTRLCCSASEMTVTTGGSSGGSGDSHRPSGHLQRATMDTIDPDATALELARTTPEARDKDDTPVATFWETVFPCD